MAELSPCPDGNPACDGSDLLHGEWCRARHFGYVRQARSLRYGFLLSEIELLARSLLDGSADDHAGILALIRMHLNECDTIFGEVSREALDKAYEQTKEMLDG